MRKSLDHPALLGAIGTGAFFLCWEGLSRSGWVNPVMLPGPSVIVQTAWAMLADGELQAHLKASLWRAIAGFGIGEVSKIFLIFWGVFFPVWVNTYLGVRDPNPLLGRAAASLGARGWRMLLFVVLPGALPFILAGLRISLSVAMVLLGAAELAGAMAGVGYLIQMSQQVFRGDQMFVGLISLGVMDFAPISFSTAPWRVCCRGTARRTAGCLDRLKKQWRLQLDQAATRARAACSFL